MVLTYKEHKVRSDTIHYKVVLVKIPFNTYLSIMPRSLRSVWKVLYKGDIESYRQFCQTYDYDPSRN